MGRRQSGGRRMHRYALRDDQWDKIKDFLPGREGHVGEGSRQLPVRRRGHLSLSHGHPVARSWCESGVFMRVFAIMSRDADNEFVMLDATIVRAHQHSAGAQKKTARIKRSAARVVD